MSYNWPIMDANTKKDVAKEIATELKRQYGNDIDAIRRELELEARRRRIENYRAIIIDRVDNVIDTVIEE